MSGQLEELNDALVKGWAEHRALVAWTKTVEDTLRRDAGRLCRVEERLAALEARVQALEAGGPEPAAVGEVPEEAPPPSPPQQRDSRPAPAPCPKGYDECHGEDCLHYTPGVRDDPCDLRWPAPASMPAPAPASDRGIQLATEHADFIARWYADVFAHGYKHGLEDAAPASAQPRLERADGRPVCWWCKVPMRITPYGWGCPICGDETPPEGQPREGGR